MIFILVNLTPNLRLSTSYFIPFKLHQSLNNSYISFPNNSIVGLISLLCNLVKLSNQSSIGDLDSSFKFV